MTAPTTTTGVNVDFKDPTITAASTTRAGSAGSGTPTVGTNQQARWDLWDPNRWWTDWRIPPKPQATWERWFDWVKQLRAQVPAIRAAAEDWRTLTAQLDDGLQAVRRQRPELAAWTGPTGRTMSQALDNLETAVRTRADAIRANPAALETLARGIEDSVGPMSTLDQEYQQVLTNDAQCRAVALRGAPIMIGLADMLLTTGNTLQNSARDETRAPMAAPVLPLVLRGGEQGPGTQLAQVAGTGTADPGAVVPGTVVQPPAQPTTTAAGDTTGGAVTAAPATGRVDLPTVSPASSAGVGAVVPAGASGSTGHAMALGAGGTADPGSVTAGTVVQPAAQPGVQPSTMDGGAAARPDVLLAGGSAGSVAPTAPVGGAVPAGGAAPFGGGVPSGGVPFAGAPFGGGAPFAGAAGGLSGAGGAGRSAGVGVGGAVGGAVAGPVAGGGVPVGGAPGAGRGRDREDEDRLVPVLLPPPVVGGTSGRVGVPGGLLGRTGAGGAAAVPVGVPARPRRDPDDKREDTEDPDLWHTTPAVPGRVTPPGP